MTTVSEIFETMAYGPAPESDKPALEWIARQNGAFGLFIDGRWTKPKSGDGFDVINPATTARLARVTQAGHADVAAAVAAARKAFPGWSALSRSIRVCWRCSRASTTASRFARRATWTSRSWPVT